MAENAKATHCSPLDDTMRDSLIKGLVLVAADGNVALTPESEKLLRQVQDPKDPAAERASLEPLLALAREAIRTNATISGVPVDLPLNNSHSLSLQISAAPLRSAAAPTAAVLILENRTAIQRIEELLLQADRRGNLGLLSASIAHEIKNAMVACRTYTDLLLEKRQESELAGIVRREMTRIDDLVGRMLQQSAPAERTWGPVSVHAALDYALRLLKPQCDRKEVRVERNFAASPDVSSGDEYELQQAFMNLLLNGLEAVGLGGRVSVETSRATVGDGGPPGICVAIVDDGIGIPAADQARLFEPFFTTKPHGTGLGLAITRGIISQHHGTISVQSEVNKGTTFRVFLPA